MSDSPIDAPHRNAARAALLERRYADAARELERHLAASPDDVEAELELGLVELLLGHRERFARSHAALAAKLGPRPPRTARERSLWERTQALARSTAQAAALLALAGCAVPVALAGCSSPDVTPAPVLSQPVTQDAAPPPPAPPAPPPPAPADAAASPAADAAASPAADAAADADAGPRAAATPDARPRPRPPYRPQTRYVAVHIDPVPPSGSGTDDPNGI